MKAVSLIISVRLFQHRPGMVAACISSLRAPDFFGAHQGGVLCIIKPFNVPTEAFIPRSPYSLMVGTLEDVVSSESVSVKSH